MKMQTISGFAAAILLSVSFNLHAADVASGKGTVNTIDPAGGKVNISHEAIPALKWPAMTMDMKVADRKILSGLKAGQAVTFGLIKDPKAGYVISHMEPAK